MEEIRFRDKAHECFYREMMERCGTKADSYSRALIYLLGICGETRSNVDSMFDFEEMTIKPESLHTPWQTGSTGHLTRLAFNLWNGWTEEGAERLSTPYDLFACTLAPYFWEAIKLRYPEYCGSP